MKFKIIGSGGCVSTPRPLCHCAVCVEAREKGIPYARSGCSLYIEDISTLIDTPEDIIPALNHADISKIDAVFYSHADPDHTNGMRVLEQMRLDWLADSLGETCQNPIVVASLSGVIKNIKKQGTYYGSTLAYYENKNLIQLAPFREKTIGTIHITLVPVDAEGNVCIFVFEENGHKVIYAPCDVKPFPKDSIFKEADYLIIGNTIMGEILKDGFILGKDNPLRQELFVLDEVIKIKEEYRIQNLVFTHLEEDWGKSFDDYLAMEKAFDGVTFAFDGMVIEV